MSLYNKMLFPKIQLKEFKSQVCQVLEGLEKLLNVIMVDWKKKRLSNDWSKSINLNLLSQQLSVFYIWVEVLHFVN